MSLVTQPQVIPHAELTLHLFNMAKMAHAHAMSPHATTNGANTIQQPHAASITGSSSPQAMHNKLAACTVSMQAGKQAST